MFASLYRKIFSYTIREKIYNLFLGKIVYFFRHFNIYFRGFFTYIFYSVLPKTEINKAYAFIGRHGITSYPYSFMLEYRNVKPEILNDVEKNLPYILHNNNRLYFPKEMPENIICKMYISLITEQDSRCAHCYVNNYDELMGFTLLDVGSAEGIFTLNSIEKVKHAYLFEADENWILPLQATFAPWKEKVTIVKKYISETTNEQKHEISLDNFLENVDAERLFVKMDIEGAERNALNGVLNTLKAKSNIRMSICTYHNSGDAEYIKSFVENLGFTTSFTDGLMYWTKKFNKGVIRCIKQ